VANTTLVVSVTGIVVSGVVGPTVTSWAARRAARKQFVRDQAARRREELHALMDEAASVLGLGPTRLRQTLELERASAELPEELRLWPEQVYVIGQRLRLRLGGADPVVQAYDTVRARLIEAAQLATQDDEQQHENAVLRFEASREEFLAAARTKLDARISEKEQG
jgi:hypothetical protein